MFGTGGIQVLLLSPVIRLYREELLNCLDTCYSEGKFTASFIIFLTKCEGYTGEYWLKVVFVWTECSKVCTQSTKG